MELMVSTHKKGLFWLECKLKWGGGKWGVLSPAHHHLISVVRLVNVRNKRTLVGWPWGHCVFLLCPVTRTWHIQLIQMAGVTSTCMYLAPERQKTWSLLTQICSLGGGGGSRGKHVWKSGIELDKYPNKSREKPDLLKSTNIFFRWASIALHLAWYFNGGCSHHCDSNGTHPPPPSPRQGLPGFKHYLLTLRKGSASCSSVLSLWAESKSCARVLSWNCIPHSMCCNGLAFSSNTQLCMGNASRWRVRLQEQLFRHSSTHEPTRGLWP